MGVVQQHVKYFSHIFEAMTVCDTARGEMSLCVLRVGQVGPGVNSANYTLAESRPSLLQIGQQ